MTPKLWYELQILKKAWPKWSWNLHNKILLWIVCCIWVYLWAVYFMLALAVIYLGLQNHLKELFCEDQFCHFYSHYVVFWTKHTWALPSKYVFLAELSLSSLHTRFGGRKLWPLLLLAAPWNSGVCVLIPGWGAGDSCECTGFWLPVIHVFLLEWKCSSFIMDYWLVGGQQQPPGLVISPVHSPAVNAPLHGALRDPGLGTISAIVNLVQNGL